MELLTAKRDLDLLPADRWERATVVDLILDDGTYIPGASAINGIAFGVVIGGHTGVLGFHEVPQLIGRRVVAYLRHTGIIRVPVFGEIPRAIWARRHGVRRRRPSWLPTI